jgi:3-deoxy-D-manno-octulosonate 8-phosphate phosphatase (KDO 8-P phosphatase)
MSPSKIFSCKLFAIDVDGTLTDGKIYMGANGEMFKAFNVKDGMGIKLLMEQGIIVALITSRYSKIVENRAKELSIHEVHQGIADKKTVINALALKYGITKDCIAYMGDDVNDLDVMVFVGCSFCPADSVQKVIDSADIVLNNYGGNGAVREAAEMILKGQVQ